MSDDKDDLELAALQRQLDDAFETTRPRRGYEDELWLKLQARRPFWSRLRDALAGFAGGIREVPALPAATVAAVLVLAVGLGVLAVGGGLHIGGGTGQFAPTAVASVRRRSARLGDNAIRRFRFLPMLRCSPTASAAPSYALGIATQAPPAAWMRLHNCSATARVGAGRRTW